MTDLYSLAHYEIRYMAPPLSFELKLLYRV